MTRFEAQAGIGAGPGAPKNPVGDPGRAEYQRVPDGVQAFARRRYSNPNSALVQIYLGKVSEFPVNGSLRRQPNVEPWDSGQSNAYIAASELRHNLITDNRPNSYYEFYVEHEDKSGGSLYAVDPTSTGLRNSVIYLEFDMPGTEPSVTIGYSGRNDDGVITKTSDSLGVGWLSDVDGNPIDPTQIPPGVMLSDASTQWIYNFIVGQGEFATPAQA